LTLQKKAQMKSSGFTAPLFEIIK